MLYFAYEKKLYLFYVHSKSRKTCSFSYLYVVLAKEREQQNDK